MKKLQKFGILAACFVAAVSFSQILSVFASTAVGVPTGFGDAVEIEVSSTNEALNHWQYYITGTLDEKGNSRGDKVYEDKNVRFKATADGRTGNAMLVEKKTGNGSLVAYPYAIDVTPAKSYTVSAYVKIVCEESIESSISFTVKELDENGVKTSDEKPAVLSSVTGATNGWQKVEFLFTTSENGAKIVPMAEFKGKGDFYLDDMAVRATTIYDNTVSYKMQAIGKLSDGASDNLTSIDGDKTAIKGMRELTVANISSDSSDGDGASLIINDGEVFKTNFAALSPDKTYRFSFKYKHVKVGSKNTLSIRFDYVTLTGERLYYIDVINGSSTEWLTCSRDVKGVAGYGSQGVSITASAKYLIDELSIVCLDEQDPMQYIVNGSFSGAYTAGYTLGANVNVAVQSDGTSVFAAGNGVYDPTVGQRGFVEYVPEGLTKGKQYTLGFDYRFSGAAWINSILVYHGGVEVINLIDQEIPDCWTNKTYTFTANGNDKFMFYGPSYYVWVTYYRNITITDESGTQFNNNVSLAKPQTVYGENILNNGTFDGNVGFVSDDWAFEGDAGIYGIPFDSSYEGNVPTDGSERVIWLNGTAENAALAISKEIAVAKRTLAVALTCCNGNIEDLIISAVAGDKEIFADENGFIELPEGVGAVKIKFASGKYVALGKIVVYSHTHATPDAADIKAIDATCTRAGGKVYVCADCNRTVYVEKTALKDHELEHIHVDATCKDGVDKDVCKVCKAEFNVKVLQGDTAHHKFGVVVLEEATCVKNGKKLSICEYCGAIKDRAILPATGKHTYKNGVCTGCGAEDPDYKGDSSNGTSSGSGTVKPSCGGCGSNVSGGFFGLGILGAAVLVVKRKK